MPFGLKNAGATYQRLMDKALNNQVGRNIEVYIDDLVIKSHTETEMLRDIDETFRTLRKINMKLNPKKCTFGAVEGMFLGYMICLEGRKPCPDKTEAVVQLPSPRTFKEVQSLNGKLAPEKALPLFKTLKKCIKKSDFLWTPEAEQAFKQLKQHLLELPMLVAPKPKEELIVYMSASHGAISVVLMTERDTIQTPVYFLSRALQGLELNYTPMKKLVLALVFAAKRSSWVDGSGVGLILTSPDGTKFTYALRFQFTASNNEAEYEALIAGLRIAVQIGVRNVHVLVEVLKEKSIQEKEVATVVEKDGPTWMTPIMEYLKDGTLSYDTKEASKFRIKARQYELLEGVLYRRSFLKPWLRTTVRGGQSHTVGILLANHASGHTGYDTQIRNIKGQVFDSRYGLFYEVDRGESRGDNHWQSGEEVRVGQHHVPLWLFERNSLGQRMPTYHTAVVDVVHNDEELRLNLDLLEERHKRAAIREAKAKLKMTKYYNARVRGVTFRPGDFVYRSNDASHAVDGGSLAQSGMDLMRSRKHSETERTC
nr:reverse transcriptase domain-containing protein [Tanacetum cinerariifolium]